MTRKQLKAVDRAVRGNERFINARFSKRSAKAITGSHPWHRAPKDIA